MSHRQSRVRGKHTHELQSRASVGVSFKGRKIRDHCRKTYKSPEVISARFTEIIAIVKEASCIGAFRDFGDRAIRDAALDRC